MTRADQSPIWRSVGGRSNLTIMNDQSRHKKETADVFGDAADAYLSSDAHLGGQDLELLVEWCEEATTVLDVATGAGHTAGAIAETSVPVVIAADASPAMVKTAETEFDGVCGVVADAEELPFATDAFDAVACRIAAHHFPNPRTFVAEVARVIRPDGTFAFEDNVVPEEDELGSFYNAIDELRDPTHIEAYRTSVWREWTTEAGFSIDAIEHVKKEIEFEPWLNRKSIDSKRKEQVRDLMLDVPPEAVDRFDIVRQRDEGRIESFANWKALIRATRRP